MKAKVSVVLPVYQAAAYIKDSITSILDQGYSNLKLIVVLNRSDRETIQIAKSFKDKRLQIHDYNQVADVALATNYGASFCNTEYIARMDADDQSTANRISRQIDFLETHPEIDLVSGQVKILSHQLDSRGFERYIQWQNSLASPSKIYSNRYIESPIVNPTYLMRKSVWNNLNGYRSGSFPEDYDFWLRFLEAGFQASKLKQCVLQWRDHKHRLSRTHHRYSESAFLNLKLKYLMQELRDRNIGLASDSTEVINPISRIDQNSNKPKTNKRPPRRLALWGAGNLAKQILRILQSNQFQIVALIEINPKKVGQQIHGIPVIWPADLGSYRDGFILSCVPGADARLEIESFLEGHNKKAVNDYYCLA